MQILNYRPWLYIEFVLLQTRQINRQFVLVWLDFIPKWTYVTCISIRHDVMHLFSFYCDLRLESVQTSTVQTTTRQCWLLFVSVFIHANGNSFCISPNFKSCEKYYSFLDANSLSILEDNITYLIIQTFFYLVKLVFQPRCLIGNSSEMLRCTVRSISSYFSYLITLKETYAVILIVSLCLLGGSNDLIISWGRTAGVR